MSVADSRFWLRRVSRTLGLFASLFGFVFAASAFAAPTDENQVIVPNRVIEKNAPPSVAPSGTGALTVIGVLGLAGAGGWLLWRARAGGMSQFNRMPRQLAVEETRSLGNRQFLVVASYQDKKFLLGVCPGRIDLLSALHASSSAESEKIRS